MRNPPSSASGSPPATQFPIYWFYLLEQAIGRGDFRGALDAQRELEALGYSVRYAPCGGQPIGPRAGKAAHVG